MREVVAIVLAVILIIFAMFKIEPIELGKGILKLVLVVQLTDNKIAFAFISQRGLCFYYLPSSSLTSLFSVRSAQVISFMYDMLKGIYL